jgi:hypothetical protein
MTTQNWSIIARTQGAKWDVVTGLSSRDAADRAMQALLSKSGLMAADASGREIPVRFSIEEERCP